MASVASAVSTLVVPRLFSVLPWWIAPIAYTVPFLVATNVYTGIISYDEMRADDFAIEHATDEELIAAEYFVLAGIEINKEFHAKYPQLFTKDGDCKILMDHSHNSYNQRLALIRKALQKRNIPPIEIVDLERMQKIKEFYKDIYLNFAKMKLD
jgi:hypothetical protein